MVYSVQIQTSEIMVYSVQIQTSEIMMYSVNIQTPEIMVYSVQIQTVDFFKTMADSVYIHTSDPFQISTLFHPKF